jgi:LacI family transcriptional regulator
MAQSLRSGTTRTIGLLIPDMHNPHYWQIAQGVESEAQKEGYDLLLTSTSLDPDRERHSVQALSRRRIDGLILLLTYSSEHIHSEIEAIANRRRPVVFMNGNHAEVDSVTAGYRECAEQVMTYLVGLGHTRIGMVYGVAHPTLGMDRLEAYRQGLMSAGLPLDDALIERCGTTIEDGYQAAARLLKRSEPTAVVVINDLLAIGTLRAIADAGLRVPDDVSVASFDDISMAAYLNPRLTTVQLDAEQYGRAAAQLLFRRLNNPKLPPQQRYLASQLIIRESTAPPPL